IRVAYGVDGARILEVLPNSPAAKAGLRPGDRIVAVEGEPVDQAHPLADHLRRYRPGDIVHLTVLRDGEERIVAITLGHAP
ncbi:MAG: S1C family serine protease, partial [Thermoflexus sp.]